MEEKEVPGVWLNEKTKEVVESGSRTAKIAPLGTTLIDTPDLWVKIPLVSLIKRPRALKKDRVFVNCKVCNISFYRKKHMGKLPKYCSYDCYEIARK